MALRDVEAVLVRIRRQLGIVIAREPLLILLLPHIREPFEEQQSENISAL